MFRKFDISMLVLGMPFDGDTLHSKSLGGAESAGLCMAKALSAEGARVSLFCNTRSRSVHADGVRYFPAQEWPAFAKEHPHDVSIVQRSREAFAQKINARLTILWCHDLALGREERALRASLWNIDRIMVLSTYMQRQYSEILGLEDDAFYLSRNGVDPALFMAAPSSGVRRDRRKLIYAARPERGLDVLLRDIMPALLAQDRGYRLYIAGYDNNPPEWSDFYAECDRLAARLGDRVVRLGCLPKHELYGHYLSAGIYVYPTPSPVLPNFREISCISAMECQAAGLPIVSTSIGALPETIAPGAGALIDLDPSDERARAPYVERFISEVRRLTTDDNAWIAAHESALARAQVLGWADVARDWLAEFERMIRARNDSPARLLRNLWRTSDIVPAKHLLAEEVHNTAPEPASKEADLLAPWSFMEAPDGFRVQYERIRQAGAEYQYELEGEPRFEGLVAWLTRCADVGTILDFGSEAKRS